MAIKVTMRYMVWAARLITSKSTNRRRVLYESVFVQKQVSTGLYMASRKFPFLHLKAKIVLARFKP